MATFLTTQEMQDLISVDRSTVYRMAEDGRLPGIKVGRQWRFPIDQVEAQLGLSGLSAAHRHSGERTGQAAATDGESLGQLLTPEALRSVTELLADTFDLMAVVTDMDGTPLTPVANACGFYAAVQNQPGAAAACVSGWRDLAEQPHLSTRFVPSHLGFLCARAFVWIERRPVGMLVVGGVTPDVWPPDPLTVERIAMSLGMRPHELASPIDETYDVDPDRQRWMLRVLPQLADLVSQLATARRGLVAAPSLSPTPQGVLAS